MNILVLNGSPKGEYSITLQTIRYLECLHPEHSFLVLPVGSRIKALEKDFSKALNAIEKADLVLYVADSSSPLDESDFEIMDYLKEKKTIIILNKSDLMKVTGEEEIKEHIQELRLCDNKSCEMGNAPVVMPLALTKGLEFDDVIIVDDMLTIDSQNIIDQLDQ